MNIYIYTQRTELIKKFSIQLIKQKYLIKEIFNLYQHQM